ncbi:MAG: dihydroneopterin aldolase [Actinomycetes bacterium]
MSPGGFEGRDRIALTGIRAFGYHGVLPIERQTGQTFSADVVLHADIRRAGRTDDLAHTVDYGAVAECIVTAIEGEPVNLIEKLAQRIADDVFTVTHSKEVHVSVVEVTVHKPGAPIDADFVDVAVSITRVQ